jgi:hypothetical protein
MLNRSSMGKQVKEAGTSKLSPGLKALKKEAPEVVKKMGFSAGGKIKARGAGAAIKGFFFKAD